VKAYLMPFRPLSDRHAIQEVVFVLHFSRRFSFEEMETFAKAHDRWQGELPKLSRDAVTLMVARGPAPPEVPSRGTTFESFKQDGTPAWRMKASDNWLAVNCLAYSRWADIWVQARSLLQRGAEVIAAEVNPVTGLTLQYIDVFVWEGDVADYDLGELLRRDSEFIPPSIWGKGTFWHLHQGWFRYEGLPQGGSRLLERMHLDAVTQGEAPVVKFDNTLRLDLREGIASAELFGDDALVSRIFEQLHYANKVALRAYLNDAIIEGIGLNV
jgi:uncharacterized protein (TIGR04255 family)